MSDWSDILRPDSSLAKLLIKLAPYLYSDAHRLVGRSLTDLTAEAKMIGRVGG